ncbi:hypothetical protein [Sorangium sp. So ce362]|uniref:hypothetical protein n=1 Tax=Sorangium sp. So ce362 TaxID=3133303 RepID=UPI003F5FBA64
MSLPIRPAALLTRAEEAYRARRWAEALAHAEAGLAAPGDLRSALLRYKALALIRLGRADEAEELLTELMVEAPDGAFMAEVAAAMAG